MTMTNSHKLRKGGQYSHKSTQARCTKQSKADLSVRRQSLRKHSATNGSHDIGMCMSGYCSPAVAEPTAFCPSCLDRVSAIRSREGDVVGLSYRVGRHVPGAATPFKGQLSGVARNMLQQPGMPGSSAHHTSILLVGRPGVGKTTLLRDMARVLADDHKLAVMVVDSSLEIAGVLFMFPDGSLSVLA
jgi:hypothetical protein